MHRLPEAIIPMPGGGDADLAGQFIANRFETIQLVGTERRSSVYAITCPVRSANTELKKDR
jgi:hypothetical protein